MSLDSTRDLSDSSEDDSCRSRRSKLRTHRTIEQVRIHLFYKCISRYFVVIIVIITFNISN